MSDEIKILLVDEPTTMSGKSFLMNPIVIIAAHLVDKHTVVSVLDEPEPFPIRNMKEFKIEPFTLEMIRTTKENKPPDWKYRKGKQHKRK